MENISPALTRREEQERYKALDAVQEHDDDLEAFLMNFQDRIIDNHSIFLQHRRRMRGIAFLQSSGCGKSRLIRQVGNRVPSFVITLGDPNAPNPPLPRPDKAVYEYFQMLNKPHRKAPGNFQVAALLSALLRELYLYVAASLYDDEDSKDTDDDDDDEDPTTMVKRFYGSDSSMNTHSEADDTRLAYTHLEALAGEYVKEYGEKKTVDDVCRIIKQLQGGPQSEKSQMQRNVFLKRVTWRALNLVKGMYIPMSRTRRYLKDCKLYEHMRDFFDLLQDTLDSDGQHRTLSSFARTPPKRHQFIFGVDECHNAVGLIDGEKRPPYGIQAFTDVFSDLDRFEPESPYGRVWLALLDSKGIKPMLSAPSDYDPDDSHYCAVPSIRDSMTIWEHYREDLPLLSKLKQDPEYMASLTIGQMHHLNHLRLTGRGVWSAHTRLDTLLDLAIIKLTGRSQGGDAIGVSDRGEIHPLLQYHYDQIRPHGWYYLDLVTYAVASLRFGLDCNSQMVVSEHQLPAVEAIASHMRALKSYSRHHRIGQFTTTTPSEPILSLAALVLLNYGQSYVGAMCLDPMRPYLHRDQDKGQSFDRVQVAKDHGDIPWRNMLKELSSALMVNAELFDVGDQAQLISRIILTRARDCTLPSILPIKEACSAPFTTLGQVITKLIGGEAAELLKHHWEKEWRRRETKGKIPVEEDWSARVWSALVNFNQFVPYPAKELGSSAKEGVKLDSEHGFQAGSLCEGFLRQSAYICESDTPGVHHAIPIMVPTEEMYEELLSGKKSVSDTTVSDYYVEYVAVLSRWEETSPYDEVDGDFALFSTPIYDSQGEVISSNAVLSIFMDLGASTAFDASAADHHHRAKPLTSWVAGGVERQNMVFEDGPSYFFSLRIRGMTCAYPCLQEIDALCDDGQYRFEKDCREVMAERRRSQDDPGTKVMQTIPFYHREADPGVMIRRARKEGEKVECRDILRASPSPPSSP